MQYKQKAEKKAEKRAEKKAEKPINTRAFTEGARRAKLDIDTQRL